MQYRAYKFTELKEAYPWDFQTKDEGTFEFWNFDTLTYAAGGVAIGYEIDNDYTVANNSTVYIAEETKAVAGQIIALIDDAGTYDVGVITSVDNEKRKILYKSLLSLFDGAELNPTRDNGTGGEDDPVIKYLYDGVEGTGRIIAAYYASQNTDRYKRLPIIVRTSGGGKDSSGKYNVPAVWDYTGNTVNLRTWLVDLFNKHNVVVQFRLVFEASRAYIDVFITHNTTEGRILKNNIHGMTVTHTEDSAAAATVCQVIDGETKTLLSTWYLLSDNTVTRDASSPNRVQPYKLTVAEFNVDNSDGATEQDIAEDALRYNDFNHYISVKIDRNSAMMPKNLRIGDAINVVTEQDDMMAGDAIVEDYSERVWKSIYTGRKESSDSSEVTLIFGKIRINYTDLIQMQTMRAVRGA